MTPSSVRAEDFQSTTIYRSDREPGYAAWASFFPGPHGTWYVGCEEVSKAPADATGTTGITGATPDQLYAFGLPNGYDKSKYRMEMVLLESRDDLRTWQVVSRVPARYQHSAGQFGQAFVAPNRFVRFVWQAYALDDDHPGRILRVSTDGGSTWKSRIVHDPRFASYPHRLRTLRDGTLVLALPFSPRFDVERPRNSARLGVDPEPRMTFTTSTDGGDTWSQPIPLYGSRGVSETDFVELPQGDLLFVNGTIFQDPGRQIVRRTEYGWLPEPYEKCRNCEGYTVNPAPETIAMNDDGILVGALRNGRYSWSDDYGLHWYPLEGIPAHIMDPPGHGTITEIYQPWIQYLGHGEFACVGHHGFDDPLDKEHENYINMHRFRLVGEARAKQVSLTIRRQFEGQTMPERNHFQITFTSDGAPAGHRNIEFWYFVLGSDEGADPFNRISLDERIRRGGNLMRCRTDKNGRCEVYLKELDAVPVTDIHHYVQCVARFVPGEDEAEIPATESLVYGFYTHSM